MKHRFTIATFSSKEKSAMVLLNKIIKSNFDNSKIIKFKIEHTGLKPFKEAGCFHHEVDITGSPTEIQNLIHLLD